MRALLPAIPILLTLLVSGCTIPGLPCIPGLTCTQTVEETHDVIVIDSLQALPDNVPPGGTIKLVAIISNVADVNAEITKINDIQVELYDYCEGLFEKLPDSESKQTISLLRGEKRQIEWTLRALDRTQVPVKTECTLKILARYPYSTKSITTLHLIDYTEMQRRIREGTYSEIGSYQSIGYGPIKPYIYVEGTQPIPVEDDEVNTVLSLQIKNRGKGFLSTPDGKQDATGPLIKDVTLTAHDSIANDLKQELESCVKKYLSENGGIKLIKGESTKIICPVKKKFSGNIPTESTKIIQAEVSNYWYEFRKEIKVTVEPKF